jgi:hypothetical protein
MGELAMEALGGDPITSDELEHVGEFARPPHDGDDALEVANIEEL